MSWMDSWSRPSKHATVPPPLYLTAGDEVVPYCHTCGRVISTRKSQSSKGNIVKYCSDRCRNHKPGATDRHIEDVIVALLNGEKESGIEKTGAKSRLIKGDRRIIVTCDEIEEIVFGTRHDPEKVFGRKKNRATRVLGKDGEWTSVDMDDSDGEKAALVDFSEGLRPVVRPPQTQAEVNGSIGGEKGRQERTAESEADLEKRAEGQRRAEEKDSIRRAARRGVVFGFVVDDPDPAPDGKKGTKSKATSGRKDHSIKEQPPQETRETSEQRRKCEAIMNGSVVEPSFAKGDWSIRWRE